MVDPLVILSLCVAVWLASMYRSGCNCGVYYQCLTVIS